MKKVIFLACTALLSSATMYADEVKPEQPELEESEVVDARFNRNRCCTPGPRGATGAAGTNCVSITSSYGSARVTGTQTVATGALVSFDLLSATADGSIGFVDPNTFLLTEPGTYFADYGISSSIGATSIIGPVLLPQQVALQVGTSELPFSTIEATTANQLTTGGVIFSISPIGFNTPVPVGLVVPATTQNLFVGGLSPADLTGYLNIVKIR